MRFRFLSVLAALTTLAALLLAVTASGASGGPTSVYVVQLKGEPAATYEGGVAGFAATKAVSGEKIDPLADHVKRYVGFLNARHDAVLARVGGGAKLYDYHYVINGFAAELTSEQASALESMKDVVSVEEAQEWYPDTATTPGFLGLSAPGGLWAQLGGPSYGVSASDSGGAGEGVVVGIIDSGIWPEHPSVSDRAAGKLVYKPLAGNRWRGKCASSEDVTDGSWDANLCNNKLVGARFFLATREAVLGPVATPDFRSPRDSGGHGTHVGTTAAGNFGVQPTGDASAFGQISGIAPRARLAAYKVCWPSCFTADSAAAFDQAVADGVDVINFSISGSTTAVTGFVPDATRRAAEAGVFVSMSAGNNGAAGDSTVAHVFPWVTTVGNSTHPRGGVGSVEANGATYSGGSLTGGVGPKPTVYAGDAALPGVTFAAARQCLLSGDGGGTTGFPLQSGPTLDPAKVNGKIIVCDRGVNVLVNKAAAARNAGAAGMILANGLGSADTVFSIMHVIPSVHVNTVAGNAIRAYVEGNPSAITKINPFQTVTLPAPFMSTSSSRGPQAGTGNLLKPDVTAPGTDILAGYSPTPAGRLFDIISGTSMASPHVAGTAALLKHRHPNWTPMMIKSALMTTGYDVLGSFSDNASASSDARRTFAQGGGHIRPTLAADAGLVFEHGASDWRRYICGLGQSVCTDPLPATELNGASIAVAGLSGTAKVVRTARSVSSESVTYTASFSGLSGISAAIDLGMFTVPAGGTHTFEVTFTRTSTAPLSKYQAGHLTLMPTIAGKPSVRIPIVVRPVPIAAPVEVESSNGSAVSWTVRTGYEGVLNAPVVGLTPATETAFTVAQDPDATFVRTDPIATVSRTITVPANSVFRAGIYEDAIVTPGTDLDLYVYSGTTLVGASADPDSNEEVTFRTGTSAVTVTVYVHGYHTGEPTATGTLFDWVVTSGVGNTTVTGLEPATIAGTQTHTASFGSLSPGTRYLGEVRYDSGGPVIGRTLLRVSTP